MNNVGVQVKVSNFALVPGVGQGAGGGGGGGGAFAISTEGGTSIHTENATTVIETEAA
jgi:hypothetical protein